MNKIKTILAREIRKVLPAFILFLFLFHLIALTKAVLLDEFSITALRATTSTLGALIVAKAILSVEALPIARLFSKRRIVQVLWKTLLFALVALIFRFIEEIIPLTSKHDGVVAILNAMFDEISWPLFWVLALWILGGLLFYSLASELVHAVGPETFWEMLFGKQGKKSE